jgi:hypothetical protein
MAKKPVSDQMELFEDGGFKDQGNTKDPISNNPVPVGSTKKEVRDDIPANLSEGEFVLPADVVRYHGLEKIMGIRDQAKQGLQKMENMGQMGNSDQATLPDGTPFQQMAEGGAVPVPTIQQPEVVAQNQVPGVQYVPPTTQAVRPSIYSFNQQMPQVTVPTQPSVTVPTAPAYQAPAYRQSTSTAATPKFSNLLGTQFGQLQESVTKKYVNKETGEEMYIPFVNGEPIYPIPNGFVEETQIEKDKQDEDINKAVQSTSVRQQQGDNDSGGFDASSTKDYQVAMQLSSYDENEKADKDKSLIGKLMSSASSLIEKLPLGQIVDKLTPEYERQAGFNMPANVTEAKALTENKKDPSYLDLLARQSGYESLDSMTKQYGVEPTFKFGTKPGDVSLVTGKPYNFAGQSDNDGAPAYASWEDWTNSLAASAKTGWMGGTMTPKQIDDIVEKNKKEGKTWDRRKVDAYMKEINKTYGKKDDDKYDSKVKKTPSIFVEPFDEVVSKGKSTKISDVKNFGMGSGEGVDSANVTTQAQALTASSTFDTSSNDGSSENTTDTSYGGEGVGGWTAQGGFINKRTMTMSKTPPNKKKRGGLASRR